MSAEELLKLLSQLPFGLVFLYALLRAIRQPWRVNLDIALFFGAITVALAAGWVEVALGREPFALSALRRVAALALPYLMLRLVQDFAGLRRGWRLIGLGGFLLLGSAFVADAYAQATRPDLGRPAIFGLLILLGALYFLGPMLYASLSFLRQARWAPGVTRRRMEAVAGGSLFLGLAALVAGLRAALPPTEGLLTDVMTQVLTAAGGLAYFAGFAPPGWLRRVWQEPALHAFLGRSTELVRLPDREEVIRELERSSAEVLGASRAYLAWWDERAGGLRVQVDGRVVALDPQRGVAGRALRGRQAVLSTDPALDDPDLCEALQARDVRALLAAPLPAGEGRPGVLMVAAARAPIFSEDDLEVVTVLARQAAVVLESHALVQGAVHLQAREEATRLKEDFLSAAAHDLKTPLTALVTQVQWLERRVERQPDQPLTAEDLLRLSRQMERLRSLIMDLLDAVRLDRERLVERQEGTDLAGVAHQAAHGLGTSRHEVLVESGGPLLGSFDPARMAQLIRNLVDNAIKFSPRGGEVRLRVWLEDGQARLAVSDQGLGVPPEERERIFERFHRASGPGDRGFSGMGLGLYLCQAVAEGHGGRIWVESEPGRGSTFHVALPLQGLPLAAAPAVEGG